MTRTGRAAARSSRDPLGDRSAIDAGLQQVADRFHDGRLDTALGEVEADRGASHDRAQVADGVAPALVELAGLDDDVGQTARPVTDPTP